MKEIIYVLEPSSQLIGSFFQVSSKKLHVKGQEFSTIRWGVILQVFILIQLEILTHLGLCLVWISLVTSALLVTNFFHKLHPHSAWWTRREGENHSAEKQESQVFCWFPVLRDMIIDLIIFFVIVFIKQSMVVLPIMIVILFTEDYCLYV